MTPLLVQLTHARSASIAGAVAACLFPLVASAQVRTNVDVSAGATAASNPFLIEGSGTSAVGMNLTVEPSLVVESAATSVKFSGNLSLEKFFKYRLDDSILLDASGEHRIDERTTLTAGVDFSSSNSAARRYLGGAVPSNVAAGELPDNVVLDPTLANLTGRTDRVEVNASVKRLLDPESSLVVNAGIGLTTVSSASGKDYRDTNLAAEYTRTLNETTSALITVEGGYADYLGQRAGDGLFITSLVGVDHRFSQAIHLSAQLGASVAVIESPAGDRKSTVVWAGKLDVCDQSGRGSACLTGTRSTRPTSFGGLTTVSSLGFSYAYSFGINDSVSLAAYYARTSGANSSFVNGLGGNSESVNVSGTYRRKVGERLAAFVTPSFASVKDDLMGRRENYQALVGISYSFGKRQ